MAYITENQRIAAIIKAGAQSGMTFEEILRHEVELFFQSDARQWMLRGEAYYRNETEIGAKRRDNPKRHNARLAHGFVRKLVDQRVGYLLSKPLSISTEHEGYAAALNAIMDKAFRRTLMYAGREAVNKGVAWTQVYIDEAGRLGFALIPSEELIPLWRDAAHTSLEGMIRRYVTEAYEGRVRKDIVRVEYWSDEGVRRYVQDGQRFVPDVEMGETSPHLFIGQKGHNFERVPFVAWKYNDKEQPLVSFIKALVDDYDLQRSTIADVLSDVPVLTYVLKGYGGQDMAEFLKDLRETGAISIDSGQGAGVDTLSATLDTAAAEAHLTRSRKDIYEFGRGVDTQTVQLGNSPSGVSLRFLYADLDMDCNAIETEFQASLEHVKWFIDTYLSITGKGDFRAVEVEFVFNRDIAINELEAIQMCRESAGAISEETILANHPWVTDVEKEIEKLAGQREAHMSVYAGFAAGGETNEDG